MRKGKTQLELTLVSNAKNYRKSFYRYVSQKRNVRQCTLPINMTGKLVTRDEEKADGFSYTGQDH